MIEITSQVLTELSEVFNDSTQGKWHKGMTTHHTVCDSAGLKKYPIAEFHHASDAQFCDTAHEFMPLLAEEITRLRAENEVLKADAARGRFVVENGGWYRNDEEQQTRLAVLVPYGSDLSCKAARANAIDAAMKGGEK